MLMCKDCELASFGPNGQVALRCNPFTTIKEPECVQKWQLLKLDALLQAYTAQLATYRRMAPLQEKMMKFMEREMDDINESDKWKAEYDEEDEDGGADEDEESPFGKLEP
jgi:hypothetical protein